jgi:osmoprotectant transport system substrate-binding protein
MIIKKTLPAVTAIAIAIALAGCATAGSSSEPNHPASSATPTGASVELPAEPGSVTIGSADFPENDILAHIFADAMTAKGVNVTVHSNVGERPAYLAALNDGSIGAIPEYSGSILSYLDTTATEKAPDEVYSALQSVAAQKGFTVTNQAQAEDADTITVTKETAAKYHLKSISDLKDVASTLRLGAPAPFQTVPYGISGLKSVYGVQFSEFVPLAPSGSITQTALANGTVDAADIFTTDPAIERNGFVVLDDPDSLFSAQNVVPLFRQDVLTQPMADACNAVAAVLTTADLRDLVSQVADGASSETVAAKWITDHNLG